jgi:hypothetical protein
MRLWCFRRHQLSWQLVVSPVTHTPSDFLLCQLTQSLFLIALLVAIGLLDADTGGGTLYFRLRFWRPSVHRAWAIMTLRDYLKEA